MCSLTAGHGFPRSAYAPPADPDSVHPRSTPAAPRPALCYNPPRRRPPAHGIAHPQATDDVSPDSRRRRSVLPSRWRLIATLVASLVALSTFAPVLAQTGQEQARQVHGI